MQPTSDSTDTPAPPTRRAALAAGLAGIARVLVPVLVLLAGLAGPGAARAQDAAAPLPTFAELEAAGATIGEIRIVGRDIFDTRDPKEDKLLFRWANALHIQTRTGVIERSLLFKRGDPLSVRLIEESERVLRSVRYIYDVQFRPIAVNDGVVDIEVETRDTWSLDFGVSAGRSGGTNSTGTRLKEYNLFGTGMSLSLSRSKNVDRSSNEFALTNDHVFGSWTSLNLSHAKNSDGQRDAVSLVRPFYALDSRWSAGVSATKDDRIDSLYNAGKIASQYRHQQRLAEVFGGWSDGLIDGWVRRYTLGLSHNDDRYAFEPGVAAPAQLPGDGKTVAPFLRYDVAEDRYEKLSNRDLVGRPEIFALGFASSLRLGWASKSLGSDSNALQYAGTVRQGFEPAPGQDLIASAGIVGQWADRRLAQQQVSGQLRYFRPQGGDWLFYASATGEWLTRATPESTLLLGGDNGLRGYPLRYQSGTRSALFTVEERFYTDLYLWRLFRFGGAAFVDIGRAWGGPNVNVDNPGWLSNLGMGLRIVSVRAAFSNVLHVDLAFPLNTTADIKKVQFLVKSKASF